MNRLNRDTVIAVILMLFCGVFFWASFDIREPDYGVLPPSAWPRFILGLLALLSVIYLVQSLRRGVPDRQENASPAGRGFSHWYARWRNPIWCFVLFFGYVASLPVLGMLIGGVTFVFLLQNILGGWSPRSLLTHAVVALVTVGGMWSLFTFGLGVLLPVGEIFNPFA